MTKIHNREIIQALGNRIQDLRLKKGLPREELSAIANIPATQIGRIERGDINTTVSSLSAIAEALGVEVKDLFDFSPKPEASKINKPEQIKSILRKKLGSASRKHKVNKRGGYFEIWLDPHSKGIRVSNLGENDLLEWNVFKETIRFMLQQGGQAEKGNAMLYKLGEEGLSAKTIEGHLAKKIFKKKDGESVPRRITPISAILEWAGVAKSFRGKLTLVS